MLVLALDTTSRRGSLALTRDGAEVGVEIGDSAQPHGVWLPEAIASLLARHRFGVRDIDLFAVASGPGSFTGLRIGIAAVQGLALAGDRGVVTVSALDALNHAARTAEAGEGARGLDDLLVAAWMDGQRGEVFAALYDGASAVDGPIVEHPDAVLRRWRTFQARQAVVFVGDGSVTYADAVARWGARRVADPAPPLAPAIARLAEEHFRQHGALSPGAVRPLYVRRPDVELARDRVKG